MTRINSIQRLKSLALLLMVAVTLPIQAASSDTANKVKAAIIFKMTRFIQWSETIAEGNVLNLCVLGDSSVYTQLKTTEGQTSKRYNIKVKEVSKTEQSIANCNLLYIGSSVYQFMDEVKQLLKKKPILSVSDRAGFAQEGGMIQIKERAGRIRFTINLRSVKAVGLGISAQLLGLGKVIY
ncbi:MAG: YfiR family protein [Endozoicomonas sp. (ex Botrylloides leachii)]|nr:YfiR family protein [Endozoicomonas sp. (ex Botrylloides leachii)]